MVQFKEAIALPFKDFKKLTLGALFFSISSAASALSGYTQDSLQAMAIQIGLTFIGVFISLIGSGYALVTARSAMKHRFALPEFEHLFDLFLKGLLSAIISFIYALPALLVIFITFIIVIFSSVNSGSHLPFLAGIPGFAVGFILLLLIIYISPAAIFGYIENNNFTQAFDLRTVFRKSFTGQWLAATLVSILYSFVLFVVVGALGVLFQFIPFPLTLLLTAVLTSYVSMIVTLTYYTMLADVYKTNISTKPSKK